MERTVHAPASRAIDMLRCQVDSTIVRKEIDGVAFPLGAYPVEEMSPRTGYTLTFEPADGDDEDGDWEEWPDRYVFDIFLSAVRVETLCRSLFAMLPGRFYPILDVLGHDEYREVDPYVAYELTSQERFHDAIRRYRGFFYEDGLVGFGAMSEEPFVYIFVDEHKIVTVRVQADLRERVERLLGAFDLSEIDEIAGADAATHEHRGVLVAPENDPDLLTADEIVEELRNDWGLVLNIDPDTNVDDEGEELGVTAWRCLARHEVTVERGGAGGGGEAAESGGVAGALSGATPPGEGEGDRTPGGATGVRGGSRAEIGGVEGGSVRARFAEIVLLADSITTAERLMWEGMERLTGKPARIADAGRERGGDRGGGQEDVQGSDREGTEEPVDEVNIAVALDRIRPESLAEYLEQLPAGHPACGTTPAMTESRVIHARWLES